MGPNHHKQWRNFGKWRRDSPGHWHHLPGRGSFQSLPPPLTSSTEILLMQKSLDTSWQVLRRSEDSDINLEWVNTKHIEIEYKLWRFGKSWESYMRHMNHCLIDEKGVNENGNRRNRGKPVQFWRGVSRGETVRFRSGVSKDFFVNERFDEVVAGRPDAC